MWPKSKTTGFTSSFKSYASQLLKAQEANVDAVLRELYSLGNNVSIDNLVDQKMAAIIGYMLGSTILHPKADPQKAVLHIYAGITSKHTTFATHFLQGLSLTSFLPDSLRLAISISDTQNTLIQIYSALFKNSCIPISVGFFTQLKSIVTDFYREDTEAYTVTGPDCASADLVFSWSNQNMQFICLIINEFFTALQIEHGSRKNLEALYLIRVLSSKDPSLLSTGLLKIEHLLPENTTMTNLIKKEALSMSTWQDSITALKAQYIYPHEGATAHNELAQLYAHLSNRLANLVVFFPDDLFTSVKATEVPPISNIERSSLTRSVLARLSESSHTLFYHVIDSRLWIQDAEDLLYVIKLILQEVGKKLSDYEKNYDHYMSLALENTLFYCYYTGGLCILDSEYLNILRQLFIVSFKVDKHTFLPHFQFLLLLSMYQPFSIEDQQAILKSLRETPSDAFICNLLNASLLNCFGINWFITLTLDIFDLDILDLMTPKDIETDDATHSDSDFKYATQLCDAAYQILSNALSFIINLHQNCLCPFLVNGENEFSTITRLIEYIINYLVNCTSTNAATAQSFYFLLDALSEHSKRALKATSSLSEKVFDIHKVFATQLTTRKEISAISSRFTYSSIDVLNVLLLFQEKHTICSKLFIKSGLADSMHALLAYNFQVYAPNVLLFFRHCSGYVVGLDTLLKYAHAEFIVRDFPTITIDAFLGCVPAQELECFPRIYCMCCLCACIVQTWISSCDQDNDSWSVLKSDITTPLHLFEGALLTYLFYYSSTQTLKKQLLSLIDSTFKLVHRWEWTFKENLPFATILLAAIENTQLPAIFNINNSKTQLSRPINLSQPSYIDNQLNHEVLSLSYKLKTYAQHDAIHYYALVMLACPYGEKAVIPASAHYLENLSVLLFYIAYLDTHCSLFDDVVFNKYKELTEIGISPDLALRHQSKLAPIFVGNTNFLADLFDYTDEMDRKIMKVLPALLLHSNQYIQLWLENNLMGLPDTSGQQEFIFKCISQLACSSTRFERSLFFNSKLTTQSFLLYQDSMLGLFDDGSSLVYITGQKSISNEFLSKTLNALHVILHGFHYNSQSSTLSLNLFSIKSAEVILTIVLDITIRKLVLTSPDWSHCLDYAFPVEATSSEELIISIAISGFGVSATSKHSSFDLGTPYTPTCGLSFTINGYSAIIRLTSLPRLTLPFKIETNTTGTFIYDCLFISPFILTQYQILALLKHKTVLEKNLLFGSIFGLSHDLSLQLSIKSPTPSSTPSDYRPCQSPHPLSASQLFKTRTKQDQHLTIEGRLDAFCDYLTSCGIALHQFMDKYIDIFNTVTSWKSTIFTNCTEIINSHNTLKLRGFFCSNCSMVSASEYLLFDLFCAFLDIYKDTSTILKNIPDDYVVCCPYCLTPREPPSKQFLRKIEAEPISFFYDTQTHASQQQIIFASDFPSSDEYVFTSLKTNSSKEFKIEGEFQPVVNHLASVIPLSSLFIYKEFTKAIASADGTLLFDEVLFRLGYLEPVTSVPFYSGISLLIFILQALDKTPLISLLEQSSYLASQLSTKSIPEPTERAPANITSLLKSYRKFFIELFLRPGPSNHKLLEVKQTGILGSVHHFIRPHEQLHLYDCNFIATLLSTSVLPGMTHQALAILLGELYVYRHMIVRAAQCDMNLFMRRHPGIGTRLSKIAASVHFLERFITTVPKSNVIETITQSYLRNILLVFDFTNNILQNTFSTSCFVHSQGDTNIKLFFTILGSSTQHSLLSDSPSLEYLFGALENPNNIFDSLDYTLFLSACRNYALTLNDALTDDAIASLKLLFLSSRCSGNLIGAVTFIFKIFREASITILPSNLIDYLMENLIAADFGISMTSLWSISIGFSTDSTPLMLYLLRSLLLRSSTDALVFSQLLTVEYWNGSLRYMLDAYLIRARSIQLTPEFFSRSFSELLNEFSEVASESLRTLYTFLSTEDIARSSTGLAFMTMLSRITIFISASLYNNIAMLTDIIRGDLNCLNTKSSSSYLALLVENAILTDMLGHIWLSINSLAILQVGTFGVVSVDSKLDAVNILTILDANVIYDQLQVSCKSLQSTITLFIQLSFEFDLAQLGEGAAADIQFIDMEKIALPFFRTIIQLLYSACFIIYYESDDNIIPQLPLLCTAYRTAIETSFEIVNLSRALTEVVDRFLATIFSLLKTFLSISAGSNAINLDPLIRFRLSTSFSLDSECIQNMVFLAPLVSGLRTFYCLQSKSPQRFQILIQYLLLVIKIILGKNTPEEIFKYYLSDLAIAVNTAQFFFITSFMTGELVDSEDRRILSGSRRLLEPVSPNEFLVYQNIQKFDCTLQIRCRITAPQEIQKAFSVDLEHIQRCASSSDSSEMIYGYSSHILLITSLIYGLACSLHSLESTVVDTCDTFVSASLKHRANWRDFTIEDIGPDNYKIYTSEIITEFILKNLCLSSIDRACGSLTSLFTLILTEGISTSLAGYTTNTEIQSLKNCMYLARFISSTLSGVSYKYYVENSFHCQDDLRKQDLWEVSISRLYNDIIKVNPVEPDKLLRFKNVVSSTTLHLLIRYLDLSDSSPTTLNTALKSLQSLYVLLAQLFDSNTETSDSFNLLIEFIVCAFDCYNLTKEQQATDASINNLKVQYEALLTQILNIQACTQLLTKSIGPFSTHTHSFNIIKSVLLNDQTIRKLCEIYLRGAEHTKFKFQPYKNYNTMLAFISSKPVTDDIGGDIISINPTVSEKQERAPLKLTDLFQGLNYTKFKVIQGIINVMLVSLIQMSNKELADLISNRIQEIIPFSSSSFFYLLVSLCKLGDITCIFDVLQAIYKDNLQEERQKDKESYRSLLEIIVQYSDPQYLNSNTLQSSRFSIIVMVESYLFGQHSLRLAGMGLSGSAHLTAKLASSLANAPIKSITRAVSQLSYTHLIPTYSNSVYYLLSIISDVSRHFHFGKSLACVTGYHRASHEFITRVRNVFTATCCFPEEYPISKVLSYLHLQLEKTVKGLLEANSCINLGEVLPATETVLFCVYTNYESEIILPNEGLLVLTNVSVYFIPGWKLKHERTIYAVQEHAFLIPEDETPNEEDNKRTESKEPTLVDRLVSSVRGIMHTLLVTSHIPDEEGLQTHSLSSSKSTNQDFLLTIRRFLKLLATKCSYPFKRPVSEYSITPVLSLPDSHTKQSIMEKQCLADIDFLLSQTKDLGLHYISCLPLITKIKLSDISAFLWKESAHRCTQVEFILHSGEAYAYEILDNISSRRLRLENYMNEYAFMMRVNQECSRSLLTKTPILQRLSHCQLILQNNAFLLTTTLVFILADLSLSHTLEHESNSPKFEVILPNISSLNKYISKWLARLQSIDQRSFIKEHSFPVSEANLYEQSYDLPFPQNLTCISVQYNEVFKEIVKILNSQVCELLTSITGLISNLQNFFTELPESSLFYRSLQACYHINEDPDASLGPVITRISDSMPWSQLLRDLSVPILLLSGKLSHIEAAMSFNLLAGRVSNDISLYPVLPWLTDDRNLMKTVMDQSEIKRSKYLDRYASLMVAPFLAGSHYSTSGFVAGMLLRAQPFSAAALLLHDGKYDNPDRIFSNTADLWTAVRETNLSECRELVPELFYAPNMFINESHHDFGIKSTGEVVHDLVCHTINATHCAASKDVLDTYLHVVLYTLLNREKLSRRDILPDLYQWFRLLFGDKQNSLEHFNVYYWLTYPDSVILDCISNLSTKISIYAQLKNFGIGCRDVFTKRVEDRPMLQHFYQSVMEFRGRNGSKTRVYDYFFHIDDFLRVLHPGSVTLLRTLEGEHISTVKRADIYDFKLELPWFYNLSLEKTCNFYQPSTPSKALSKTIFALTSSVVVIIMHDMRIITVIHRTNRICRTLNVPFLVSGKRCTHIRIQQCFCQEGCIIVRLTDMYVYLILFDLDALDRGLIQILRCVQLPVTSLIAAVTVSRSHRLALVSTYSQHVLYNPFTGTAIARLHTLVPSVIEKQLSIISSQICDIGGRIWILSGGVISCWSTSLALLYVLSLPYEATAFLAISESLVLVGDNDGIIRVYLLHPSAITTTTRVKIQTSVMRDSKPSSMNLICMDPSLRPSHPLATWHTEYFRERNVSVLVPKLTAELVTTCGSAIRKITMNNSHTVLAINDSVLASLSFMNMHLPRYIDHVAVLPIDRCARCNSNNPECYCHVCSGRFCPLCMSTDMYFFPYQNQRNPASYQICALCSTNSNPSMTSLAVANNDVTNIYF